MHPDFRFILFDFGARQPKYLRYLLTLLIVAATTTATIYIPVIGERAAFLLFFFGIIQTSFWFGTGAGILATILSLIAVNRLVLFLSGIEPHEAMILNAGFCFVSTIMVVTTSFHRSLAKALWESRQDLAHAQTVGQIGSWRMNVPNNRLTWSDENHRIFGIPKDTPMTYESFLSVVHPDDREYVDRMWQAALRGEPYDIEHRLIVAGKLKWVREKAVLEFDKKGKLLGGFGITQDITERITILDQFAKIAATVPGLICSFRLNPNGTACMPYASPVLASIYGFSPELISKDFSPVFARIHPDDLGHIYDTYSESARSQQPWRDEYRYNHPEKGEVWHEVHSMPQREVDGGVLWHGYVQDVTKRKLAEKALREQENELRLMMDATPALIAHLDADFRYLRVNATYANWFGRTVDSILGQKARNIIGEPAWNIVQADFEKALAGETVHFDRQIQYGDDKLSWMHASYIPELDTNGRVKGIVKHIVDITALKQAEESLMKSQMQLRLFVEQSPVSIAMFDREMNYLITSRRWLEEFGRGYKQLIGRNHYSVHPDLPPAWKQVHRQAQAGEFLKNDDDLWIQADGTRNWFRWAAYPWTNQADEIGGIIISCENITAYRKQKELSERRDKMEQSFQTFVACQTAAAMAHELNQPLTAISSYADVALQMLQSSNPNPQKLAQMVENCSLQAHRAGKAIAQLLGRLHQGEIVSEPIDINASVHEAIDLLNADGLLTDYKIALDLAAQLPPVKANTLQIQNVLINLLRNSVESMQEEGANSEIITVATLRSAQHPAMAQVSVSDSGKGVVDSAALKKFFQPFYTTKPSELGMGLTVSRSLISTHGGKMWAEQNPGDGITVHFTLPFEA